MNNEVYVTPPSGLVFSFRYPGRRLASQGLPWAGMLRPFQAKMRYAHKKNKAQI